MEKISNLAKNDSEEAFSYLNPEDKRQTLELARLLAKRDWVLFVGSGISRPSGLPLWSDLVSKMVERLGSEATELKDPLEVASLFEAIFSRSALIAFLQELLQKPNSHPNPLPDYLLSLNPQVINTTNFDNLFQSAIKTHGFPFAFVINN